MGLTTSDMNVASPAVDITVSHVPLLRLQFDEDDIDRHNMERYSRQKAISVLKQYLESDGNLSLEQAFGVLHGMMPDTGPALDFANRDFSLLFIETARQIPYSHPSQARFVHLLACLARTDRFNEPLARPNPGTRRLFEAHGPFLITLNQGPSLFPQGQRTNGDQVVNLGAFVARLLRAKVLPRASYRFPAFVLREALEYEWRYLSPLLDASTRVAWCAVWILGAGRELYEDVVLHPDVKLKFHTVKLYRGPAFGIERWKFWQDRLAEIAGEPEVADDARQLGLKAADYMGALARDISW